MLHVLRDNIRRADAFITIAERLIEQSWEGGGIQEDDVEDEDGGVMRRRHQIEYLVEAGKMAVRAANYTTDQLVAELAAQRRHA